MICDLGLPNQKFWVRQWIGNRLKKIFEDLFFLENACACVLGLWPWPWPRAFLSLASRGSVLEKAVLGLGLGFFLCSWPWSRALCPRLHLCRTAWKPFVMLPVFNIKQASTYRLVRCKYGYAWPCLVYLTTSKAQAKQLNNLPVIIESLKYFFANLVQTLQLV